MADKAREAYANWKLADDEAQKKAHQLKESWDAYIDRRGGVPPDDLIKEVSELRARANALLTIAVRHMAPGDEGKQARSRS